MRVRETESWPHDALSARRQPFTMMGLGAVATGPGEQYIMDKLKTINKKWQKLSAYPFSDTEGLKKLIDQLDATQLDAALYLPQPKKRMYIEAVMAAVEKQRSSYVNPVRISSSKNRIEKQVVQLNGILLAPLTVEEPAQEVPPTATMAVVTAAKQAAITVPQEQPVSTPVPKESMNVKKIVIGAGIAAVVAGVVKKAFF